MTKFLNQKCSYEQAKRNKFGEAQLDDYGEVQYNSRRSVKCRREQTVQDMQTGNGAILRSSTRYFIDSSVQLKADDRKHRHTR